MRARRHYGNTNEQVISFDSDIELVDDEEEDEE